ncbi:PAS domain-containing protein [Streptomyces sp. L7]
MDASGPPVHEAGPASRTDAALLVVDEHGRVSGWSHGAAELFGLNSEDALGRPASALFTSAVPEVTPGSEWRGVLPVRGPHGSTKDVPFFGYAVPSHGGEPQLLLVDRNEQSVPPRSHTEALSEWLFSGSPVAMALYDPELRCVRQSSALQKLTGVPEGDRIGEGLSAVLSGADVAQCEQRMRRVLRTGLPDIDFTVRGRTPADSDHDHSFSVSVARLEGENGRVLGVCTTVLDTTEQLRGEGDSHS